MGQTYQFTLVERPGHWRCYIWVVEAHGRGTRRRIATVVEAPQQGETTPASLLRAIAGELEKPLLERWRAP